LVHFTGCIHYTSSYKSGVAKACKAGIAKVLHLSEGKPHPYSLKAAGGGATVYGWVNASDIVCKATSTKAKTYKVVKGDALSKIAKANGTTTDILVKLNKLTNKNTIYVGQIIKLP
jgi:LysM repeat protein